MPVNALKAIGLCSLKWVNYMGYRLYLNKAVEISDSSLGGQMTGPILVQSRRAQLLISVFSESLLHSFSPLWPGFLCDRERSDYIPSGPGAPVPGQ